MTRETLAGKEIVVAVTGSIGNDVRVLDDLCTGYRENVPDGVELVVGDVADEAVAELTRGLVRADADVTLKGPLNSATAAGSSATSSTRCRPSCTPTNRPSPSPTTPSRKQLRSSRDY